MTWTKLGAEFFDECAHVDLSDAAFRTHVEAIGYLYSVSTINCRFSKRATRRFATSEDANGAMRELCDQGWWADHGSEWELIHHADVVLESLAAQAKKRDRDRASQARKRAKEQSETTPPVSDDVSADTRQTDRQTDKHLGGRGNETCKHGTPHGTEREPWSSSALVCSKCTAERKSA